MESATEFVAHMQNAIGGGATEQPAMSNEDFYTHFDPIRTPLYYDISARDTQRAQTFRAAFAELLLSEDVWHYENTAGVRRRVSPTVVEQLPGFETNVAVGFCVGDSTLYLLPDKWIVRAGDTYQFVSDKGLDITIRIYDFYESEAAPRDSEKVRQIWLYANKHGSRDLRFKDNRQIPVYRYGDILISVSPSSRPWQLHLCVSRTESARRFAALMRTVPGASSTKAADTEKETANPGPPKSVPSSVVGAFRLLDLRSDASFEEASAAFRRVATQNHPDKIAHMAPEFRELAERRMRELNAAFDQIRLHFQQSH